MITVISGTNRKDNACIKFAKKYQEVLQAQTEEEVKFLALDEIPHDWFFPTMYSEKHQAESLSKLQDDYLIKADKFVIITPEYNGSFPGAMKLFIDACSIRRYKETFRNKKAALVGVATGRAGNLRGMDHLTGVLHHVGTTVMPNHLPISKIKELIDDKGKVIDEKTIAVLEKHAQDFINF